MTSSAFHGLSSFSSVFIRKISTKSAARPPNREPEGPAWNTGETVTPRPAHHARQGHSASRTPRSQRTKMVLTYVYGCVHTELCVHHHDLRLVPTPKVLVHGV